MSIMSPVNVARLCCSKKGGWREGGSFPNVCVEVKHEEETCGKERCGDGSHMSMKRTCSTRFRTDLYLSSTVLNCCEGDVLFLVDSSGSVSSYEHSRMLAFLSELLLPFSLGEDQVRVGLLQVGTEPRLEFGFDTFSSQSGLQGALRNIKPLRGDTNTVEALRMAKEGALRPGTADGARAGLPRVLVWLTDGIKPGEVLGPMARLREEGVAVLVVSTGHGNYQVLRQVVSPPVESHLYFVDIDDMSIITEDLRDAVIGECAHHHHHR